MNATKDGAFCRDSPGLVFGLITKSFEILFDLLSDYYKHFIKIYQYEILEGLIFYE